MDKLKCTDLTPNLNNSSENELEKLEKISNGFCLIVTLLLKSFLSTHTSIIHIHLLKNEEKEKSSKTVMIYGSDAMSLVREQIEKVFVITLLCSDPIKWTEK